MTTPHQQSELEKAIQRNENGSCSMEADRDIFLSAAKRSIELEQKLAAVEKERDELKATITTITTDKDYEGGTYYWIVKHDDMASTTVSFIDKYNNLHTLAKEMAEALKHISNKVGSTHAANIASEALRHAKAAGLIE